jgi:hypothetical protein
MSLVEVKDPSRLAGEPSRRVFFSDACILIVWISEEGQPLGCQFVYDRDRVPHAISLRPGDSAAEHFSVSDGEGRAGKSKESPIFGVARHDVPRDIVGRFQDEAVGVDEFLKSFVVKVLTRLLKEGS